MDIIIVAPSLDSHISLGGISAVASFIVKNNTQYNYIHFEQGKRDDAKGGVYRIPALLMHLGKWKALLEEHPHAAIHYNFPLDASSILRDYFFIRYAVRNKMPMVVHLHGGLYLFKKDKPWLMRKMLRTIFSWPCHFIVLSNKEQDVIKREFGTANVEVLPNCVDLSEAKNFEWNNYDEEPLHILYLGRIEPNKGVDFMLSASAKLKKNGLNFVLHMAGKDQYQDYYISLFQECLKENFVYEGIVMGERKTELLKKCQVFLLPSFYEGLPISLLEGMSFGEVPIVTNVGSIGEVVIHNVNGMMVKLKDSDSIVDAVTIIANDRKMLCDLSTHAKTTIMDNFSPEDYITKLKSIYEKCRM